MCLPVFKKFIRNYSGPLIHNQFIILINISF